MHYFAEIIAVKETEEGTQLILNIPNEKLKEKLSKFSVGSKVGAELRINDGRTIRVDQRKKIFATVKDVSDHTGDFPEFLRSYLLYDYCATTGEMPFSLSNCSVTQARLYMNHIMNHALEWGIPLTDNGINRTDDINNYLYGCIKHKRCAICGKDGETHHWDAIGMGHDRKTFDDSKHRKIQLCRKHHTEAHTIGRQEFEDKYKVYGIIINEED